MKKLVVVIIIALSFIQCKNNNIEKPSKPDGLISEDKMVEVLYDMTIISAAKGLNRRVIENNGIDPEAFVYEKHGIDSTLFAESNRYYSYDIKTYEAIYARVKEKLQAQKNVFNDDLKSRATEADSIANANSMRRDSIIRVKTEEAKLYRQ